MRPHFRLKSLALAACAALALQSTFPSIGKAQNFVNSTTGQICNTGTIRLTVTTASFINSNANLSVVNMATGTIEFTGTTPNFAGSNALGNAIGTTGTIPGTVVYTNTSPSTQTVYAAQYTNLYLNGTGAQNVTSGSAVAGVFNPLSNSGTHTYSGTLTFNGTNQEIYPQFGTNSYASLVFTNGPKTVTNGQVNVLTNVLAQTGANVTITGGGFNLGQNSTFNSIVTVNGGTITTGVTSVFNNSIIVTTGTFNVPTGGVATANQTTTVGNSGSAVMTLSPNSTFANAGNFTNLFAAGTNLNFDCSSVFIYSGASTQTIQSTVESNPYGNLWTRNASKTAGGDVFVCTQLDVAGGNLVMNPGSVIGTTDYLMTVKNSTTGNVVYSGATQYETIGRIRRYVTGSTGNTIEMANPGNSIVVTQQGATPVTSLTMRNYPQSSVVFGGLYDNTRDVQRSTTYEFGPTTATFKSTVAVGYQAADIPGTWGPNVTQGTLRHQETLNPLIEKMGTGFAYSRTTTGTATWASISLPGYTSTTGSIANGLANFTSGHHILLRGGPSTFISINNGRWSNPGTWDENAEPTPLDSVIIRTNVWAGVTRTTANGGDNYSTPEKYPTSLSSGVLIDNVPNSALIFAGLTTPTADSPTQSFNLTPGATIVNNSLAGSCPSASYAYLTGTYLATNVGNSLNGLINFEQATFHASNLVNNGSVTNGGTIDIGQP